MVRLSVNVNKVATLRNSRGGALPSVTDAVRVCVNAGARGITVHPRADARHITSFDVTAIASFLGPMRRDVEFNIEGDPRPDLLEMVREVRPHQCTLVPVRPGEVTSQAGWPPDTPAAELGAVVRDLQDRGIRVSLFVDPDPAAVKWAASLGAARIELYTEPFAHAFKTGGEAADRSFGQVRRGQSRPFARAGHQRRHDLIGQPFGRVQTLPT
jgi:pyridoxine 5-phosphate synthase